MLEIIISLLFLMPLPEVDTEVLDLTARIVEQEAGNQGLEGKIAVVNVLRNRVNSPQFPSDLESVITSRGQFESYSTGRYRHVKPNMETYVALYKGLYEAPIVGDAVYFCNYANIGPKAKRWFDTLHNMGKVSNHTFYR